MEIYQHFRPEEREFIDQTLDWKHYVENSFAPKLTDFLDPREQQIVKMIIGEHGDVAVAFFGGIDTAERKRALLFPEYFHVSEGDFQISLFQVNYPVKFVTIEHRHVLGSLMSLGLKRGKFGDILEADTEIQFFAADEISTYIQTQLQSIGKASVRIEKIPFAKAIHIQESWQELNITAASLRLDAIISAMYPISRQKAQNLIERGLVKVNWTIIETSSFECHESDIISVRGFGRAKIVSIEGKTKKDKWRIVTNLQK